MIEIQGLRKRFGRVVALDDVTFSAADATITGLVGENGAGKTTTLAIVSGLLTPDTGSIRLDGSDACPVESRKRIGAVLDHQGVYAKLTARENIRYFGHLQQLSGPTLERRVEDLVRALGLEDIADRRMAGFSQGERFKVVIARAIVHSPQNVLLDEVTNGLDVPTVRSLRALLRRMRDDGRCVVFSSHVLEEVRTLCDRIVVISRRRVVARGTADAVCRECGAETLEEAFLKLTARVEPLSCHSA